MKVKELNEVHAPLDIQESKRNEYRRVGKAFHNQMKGEIERKIHNEEQAIYTLENELLRQTGEKNPKLAALKKENVELCASNLLFAIYETAAWLRERVAINDPVILDAVKDAEKQILARFCTYLLRRLREEQALVSMDILSMLTEGSKGWNSKDGYSWLGK